MRGRLRALGVEGVAARTFHAAALAQLNYFWPTLAGDTAPGIVDNKVRLLAHAADGMGIEPDVGDAARRRERDRVAQGHDAQHRRSTPPRGPNGRRPARRSSASPTCSARTRSSRTSGGSSTSRTCCSRARACSRPSRTSRAAVHEQYRHFTVDEFQDVSPLQHRLLELWLGDRRDICVVGDASQTIYSFAGADARFLLEFASRSRGRARRAPRDELPIGCRDPRRRERADARPAGRARAHRRCAAGARRDGAAPSQVDAADRDRRTTTTSPRRAVSPRGSPRRSHRASIRAASRSSTARTRSRPSCVARARRRAASPRPCSAAGASSTCPRCARR